MRSNARRLLWVAALPCSAPRTAIDTTDTRLLAEPAAAPRRRQLPVRARRQ